MTRQTMAAIAEADAILFVIDARAGITAGDQIIAQALRKSGKPVILAANKCEGRIEPLGGGCALGLWRALAISAEHDLGMAELADALVPLAPRAELPEEEDEEEPSTRTRKPKTKRLSTIARPAAEAGAWWAGPMSASPACSTSFWARSARIAGPEAGLTRDAIAAPWKVRKRARDVLLHDTAGLRKKARVAGETLEEMSVASTLDAIRFADCVIVMIDATAPFEKQDLTIADLIAREGRAIVFAVNKWDLMENKAGRDFAHCARSSTGCCRRWRARELVAISAQHRRRHRPAGRRHHRGRPRLEHAHSDRGAQPFPGRRAAAPCPARDQRAPGAHPLHDPAQDAAAHFRPVRQPARCICPKPISAICRTACARRSASRARRCAL